jgi:hypothetical protein
VPFAIISNESIVETKIAERMPGLSTREEAIEDDAIDPQAVNQGARVNPQAVNPMCPEGSSPALTSETAKPCQPAQPQQQQ